MLHEKRSSKNYSTINGVTKDGRELREEMLVVEVLEARRSCGQLLSEVDVRQRMEWVDHEGTVVKAVGEIGTTEIALVQDNDLISNSNRMQEYGKK